MRMTLCRLFETFESKRKIDGVYRRIKASLLKRSGIPLFRSKPRCEYGNWCGSNGRCRAFEVTYAGFGTTCPDGHEHINTDGCASAADIADLDAATNTFDGIGASSAISAKEKQLVLREILYI